MTKNFLVGFTSILLGLIFLFSAYIKLFPIEIFEFSFIEIKVANWSTAPFIARLFLSLEFFIGLLLILNYNGGNKKLAKFTIGLLIVFTVYLLAIIVVQGNSGNCGCFGTFIKMTPLESIVKNIILISLTGILFLVPAKGNLSTKKYLVLATAIASIAAPFIINPITTSHPRAENEINFQLKLDPLYNTGRSTIPKIDLRTGKKVIAFLSLSCPHCKIGAQKLNIIHNQYPELPIYFIFNGEEAELKDFLEESKTTDIDFTFMSLKEGFLENAGFNLPAILWVKNGKVENRTRYTELEAEALLEWYRK